MLQDGLIKKEEDLQPNIIGLEFYCIAFRELGSCRGSGPIPFDSIYKYWELFSLDSFEEFHFFIRLMDDKYLKLESNRLEKESKAKNG